MRTSRTRSVIVTAAAALGVVAGAAGIAAAGTSHSAPATATAESDAKDPSYTSSVTAPEAKDGTSEQDETAALQSKATVTADQAKAAALAAVPGTAATPQLENENGNVVWGVEVTDAAGKVTDVKVDAGNGKVLAQDTGDESGQDTESNDSETKGGPESKDAPEANDTPDSTQPTQPAAPGV
ncbi:MAG: hypothetical protein QOE35_1480 [Actinomycetota bacterium]|jgi:uncharacterized membrane protein YkoI